MEQARKYINMYFIIFFTLKSEDISFVDYLDIIKYHVYNVHTILFFFFFFTKVPSFSIFVHNPLHLYLL